MTNDQLVSILQGMDPKKKVKFRIAPLIVANIHGVHVVSCKELNNEHEDVIVLENTSNLSKQKRKVS